jgi:hypothetical protein
MEMKSLIGSIKKGIESFCFNDKMPLVACKVKVVMSLLGYRQENGNVVMLPAIRGCSRNGFDRHSLVNATVLTRWLTTKQNRVKYQHDFRGVS